MEYIQFLLKFLKDPKTVLAALISGYGIAVYGILFLIIFVETGVVVMPLLPGDSLLFSIGLLAKTTGSLDIKIVIPLLVLAALLGDNLNYFIGKKFGNLVQSREKILFLKKEHIEETEKYFEKYGAKTVILARFIPIVRTVAPFVAGAAEMNYRIYLTFCIIGAVLWVSSITLLGYFLGLNEWVNTNFEKVVLGIVFISVLPILIKVLKSKFSSSN